MLRTWFGICLALWATPVLPWLIIETNDPNILFEVDEKSIVKRGSSVMFSERLSYLNSRPTDLTSGKTIHRKIIYRIMNCIKRTQGLLQGAVYGENDSLIESIHILETKVQMQAIPKGSLAEAEADLVCSLAAVRTNKTP